MNEFRSFILRTAEAAMVVLVIVATLWSAFAGWAVASTLYGVFVGFLGFILGAASGFLFAAVVASYFFLLAEIAENTRVLARSTPERP
jgi:hypothetical protein